MRVSRDPSAANNGLHYLYADHLGGINAIQRQNGGLEQMRYTPFGGYRSGGTNQITDRAYTGQRENMDLGLYYYNARYYLPGAGRFLSADTLVPNPQNPQSFNRYAYVLNRPLNFSDPTGHFSEDAIRGYLWEYCAGDESCFTETFNQWRGDEEWWSMLRNAVEGDILFGAYGLYTSYGEGSFSFMFIGNGDSLLTGIVSTDIYGNPVDTPLPGIVNLKTIQQGKYTIENPLFLTGEQIIRIRWGGLLRTLDNGDPFIFARQVNWDNTFIYTKGMENRNNLIWGTVTGAAISLIAPELGLPTLATNILSITGGAVVSTYGPYLWTEHGGMAGDIYLDVVTNQFVFRPGLNIRIIDYK